MHIVAQLFDMISWHSAVTAGISTSLCLMFVGLAGRYPRLAGHTGNLTAVQAAHKQSTPRVAGVAIFAALVVSIFFVTEALSHRYLVFIAAASLLFVPGLLEDIGFGVSPRRRLLVAVVASMTIILTLDIWLTRSDIGWFEPYMANAFVGVSLTVLVTVGVTNGFNLIDGVNGLAGLAAMACSLALALIAHQAGYAAMVKFNLILMSAIFGFMVLNYPFGKIFLGDAGAYTIGLILSWFGILIIVRFPEVSPWAVLLTVFWPVADTCLAIYRRARRRSIAVLPDRLHVHQLVMQALEIHILGRGRRSLANPLTTITLAPFVIAPPITAVILWNNTDAALLALGFYSIAFFACYVFAFPLLRRAPRRCGHRPERAPERDK